MNKYLALWVALCISLFGTQVMAKPISKTVDQGNLHYDKAEFDQALNRYRDAQIESPEMAELHFNVGDALHKKRDYAGAMEAYHKSIAASDDATLHGQAYYNIGNSLFRAAQDSIQLQNSQGAINNMTESIEYYKKALKVNPDDQEAKYNLEYVRKILKELAQQQQNQQNQQQQNQDQQQQQQEQQQGQEGQQDEQQGEEEQQQAQQQGEEEKEEDEQQQQQSEQAENEEQPPEEQQQQQARKEGEMSKEEAERMLDALRAAEKEVQEDQQKKQAPVSGRVTGKQW